MVRVVAAGHVNWDVTLSLDRLPGADDEARIRGQRRGGGGSAANVAAALSGLDVGAAVVGCVGDDDPGRLVREELVAAGVDCAGLVTREGPTTVKYLLVAADGSVAVLGNEGLNEALEPGDVDPSLVARAEHLHLTNQPPATARDLAECARDAGLTVSFDPGRRAGERDFGAVLDRADLVFVTGREAAALFDAPRPEPRADWLPAATDRDLLVAVTRGPEGATLHRPGGEPLVQGGFDVEAVDTSGAGDAFAAGFLSVWLDGGEPARALSVGNACGALASRERGARSRLSADAVERFLAERA